uniref:6-cysteine protein n=1 Tax=Panagrolaimus sp. JU765 TaxID=591449 RepID=A0AC34RAP2_9BILA
MDKLRIWVLVFQCLVLVYSDGVTVAILYPDTLTVEVTSEIIEKCRDYSGEKHYWLAPYYNSTLKQGRNRFIRCSRSIDELNPDEMIYDYFVEVPRTIYQANEKNKNDCQDEHGISIDSYFSDQKCFVYYENISGTRQIYAGPYLFNGELSTILNYELLDEILVKFNTDGHTDVFDKCYVFYDMKKSIFITFCICFHEKGYCHYKSVKNKSGITRYGFEDSCVQANFDLPLPSNNTFHNENTDTYRGHTDDPKQQRCNAVLIVTYMKNSNDLDIKIEMIRGSQVPTKKTICEENKVSFTLKHVCMPGTKGTPQFCNLPGISKWGLNKLKIGDNGKYQRRCEHNVPDMFISGGDCIFFVDPFKKKRIYGSIELSFKILPELLSKGETFNAFWNGKNVEIVYLLAKTNKTYNCQDDEMSDNYTLLVASKCNKENCDSDDKLQDISKLWAPPDMNTFSFKCAKFDQEIPLEKYENFIKNLKGKFGHLSDGNGSFEDYICYIYMSVENEKVRIKAGSLQHNETNITSTLKDMCTQHIFYHKDKHFCCYHNYDEYFLESFSTRHQKCNDIFIEDYFKWENEKLVKSR